MRRRFVQMPDGELVEVTDGYLPEPKAPLVMGDIDPYRSMVDGSVVGGRAQHREHLKRHGCVEVGNDSSLGKPKKGIPDVEPHERKEMIRSQIANMRHEEFRRMLRNDLERIRWESRGR